MKFSFFASIACLLAGAIAAPHAPRQDIALAERTTASTALSQLQTEVNSILGLVEGITSELSSLKSGSSPTTVVAKITSNLNQVNVTLTAVSSLLSTVGFKGSIFSTFSGITSLFGGLLGENPTNAASTILSGTQVLSVLGKLLTTLPAVVSELTSTINSGKLGSPSSTGTGSLETLATTVGHVFANLISEVL